MSEEDVFFSSLDPAMLVVTATSDAGSDGCLLAFATQCSIYPPRFLVCISAVNHTATVAERAGALGVHVLGGGQTELASLFGEETGDRTDKLGQVAWRPGVVQAPILEECAYWIEGVVRERIPLGDHIGYVLDVVGGGEGSASGVLHQSEVRGLQAGHPAEESLDETR